MSDLDCVVIGYNEGDFDDYRLMCERSGPGSPERQIFSKEHLVVNGRALPWMDVFSVFRNGATGRSDRYHVAEVFNLASIYLTSYLRQRGYAAEPISLFGAELPALRKLLAERPRVVAITTTFYVNVVSVLPIVQFVRENAPDTVIVIGGPLIDNICVDGLTEDVQDLLDLVSADFYVWESQGEWALSQICGAMRSCRRRAVADIPNVIYRDGDRWMIRSRRPEANDLDECAIDWAQFSRGELGVTAQTRTARSCAFKCAFCDYPTRAGALATASVETVRRELAALAQLGVRNLIFVDDTFNVPPKRFKLLCQMMIDEGFEFDWYSYFRCSNARDDETFDLAARSGCRGVFLGIESGDSTVLGTMNKLAQDDQYRVGIQQLKEHGVITFASIITGFPGETPQTIQNTVNFLNETEPDFWRTQAWWANPRSPVYRKREALGIEGRAYTWRHHSMTSEQAAAHCDEMFDAVTGSTWLPLYDFDFWGIPYLAGKGVTRAELHELLVLTQDALRAQSAMPPGGNTSALSRLAARIAQLDVNPARYQMEMADVPRS